MIDLLDVVYQDDYVISTCFVRTIQTQILVIGSGVAGLNFALSSAAHASVLLLTKKDIAESNTNYAQGGIAAVLDPLDASTKHIEDTLHAGCGLNNREAVEIMVREGPALVHALAELGVPFHRDAQGDLLLTQEGGHTQRRIAFSGDRTGAEIERALVHAVRQNSSITVMEHTFVCDLLNNHGRIVGCIALDQATGETVIVQSCMTVMASGGAGQIYYPHTTNPAIATGDGIGMALRVGATTRDMEFFQFHPTALFKKGCPVFLLSESLRGEGAFLVNLAGECFMKRYDERGDLATRDTVARAIVEEEKLGPVFLDCRHLDSNLFDDHFATIASVLAQYDLDPRTQLIPISPAVHYMIGGIQVDLNGATTVPALYAFGEVACTGVHGANRLASNSLLEALVFSQRIVDQVPEILKSVPSHSERPLIDFPDTMVCNRPAVTAIRDQLTTTMWRTAGIVRTQAGLNEGMQVLSQLKEELQQYRCHHTFYYETRNMLLTGLEVLKAVQNRKESVGTHYVSD